MRRVYAFFGGRKAFNGLLAFFSIWIIYFVHWFGTGQPPEFKITVGALLLSLGITTGTIAWEDRAQTVVKRFIGTDDRYTDDER